MKKVLFILFFAMTFVLCSCSRAVGMSELLLYQEKDFSARVNVSGGGGFSAELKKTGDVMTLDILLPEEISGIGYVLSGGELFVRAGDMKIKLDGGAETSAAVFSCFGLRADAGWKISAVKTGGAETYMCVSSDTTVYYDKTSFCPYRFEKNGIGIDVLSFEVINRDGAE